MARLSLPFDVAAGRHSDMLEPPWNEWLWWDAALIVWKPAVLSSLQLLPLIPLLLPVLVDLSVVCDWLEACCWVPPVSCCWTGGPSRVWFFLRTSELVATWSVLPWTLVCASNWLRDDDDDKWFTWLGAASNILALCWCCELLWPAGKGPLPTSSKTALAAWRVKSLIWLRWWWWRMLLFSTVEPLASVNWMSKTKWTQFKFRWFFQFTILMCDSGVAMRMDDRAAR